MISVLTIALIWLNYGLIFGGRGGSSISTTEGRPATTYARGSRKTLISFHACIYYIFLSSGGYSFPWSMESVVGFEGGKMGVSDSLFNDERRRECTANGNFVVALSIILAGSCHPRVQVRKDLFASFAYFKASKLLLEWAGLCVYCSLCFLFSMTQRKVREWQAMI